MRASTLFWLTAASAAGYAAAQRLMATDEDRLATLPEPVRVPARSVRARLLAARERAGAAWREGVAERDSAQRELTREYEQRSGHS